MFLDELVPALAAAGIEIVGWADLDAVERKRMTEVYEQRIFPVLTPLAVDPSHPFPYISDLALSIAAMVADPDPERRPPLRPGQGADRLPAPRSRSTSQRFVPAEELIIAHLHTLFAGMVDRGGRRRSASPATPTSRSRTRRPTTCSRRSRWSCAGAGSTSAVRLEVADTMSDEMLELLVRELELAPRRRVPPAAARSTSSCLWQLHALDRPDLKDRPWPPVTAGRIAVAEEADRPIVLGDPRPGDHGPPPVRELHSSTEAFIEQAADDPRVQSIKMTLYRAGGDSPIIRGLIRAAERGVQVAVLVELKARFDEATNVNWAKQLERAGVHVVYGMVGLKTHSKCVLVVRDDGDQLRRYCHIGTGNYNTKTARLYEDLGILTCDSDIGADVAKLFNHLTGYSRGRRSTTRSSSRRATCAAGCSS